MPLNERERADLLIKMRDECITYKSFPVFMDKIKSVDEKVQNLYNIIKVENGHSILGQLKDINMRLDIIEEKVVDNNVNGQIASLRKAIEQSQAPRPKDKDGEYIERRIVPEIKKSEKIIRLIKNAIIILTLLSLLGCGGFIAYTGHNFLTKIAEYYIEYTNTK